MQTIVDRDIAGSYLWILPKKNIVIFPKKKIIRDLMHEIPRLSTIEISKESSQEISIAITERTPLALYCGDISNILLPHDCYFIDDKGYIFSEAPAFSGDVYFIYSNKEPLPEPLGKAFLPQEVFGPLSTYIKSLSSMGVHGRALVLDPEDYHLVLANSGEIIWRREDNLDLIGENLKTFLGTVEGEDKSFLNKILYIDLRFENKVFYKFQEGQE
jgi:hypothetical protein